MSAQLDFWDYFARVLQITAVLWALLFGSKPLYEVGKAVIKAVRDKVHFKVLFNSIRQIFVKRSTLLLNMGLAIVVLIGSAIFLYFWDLPTIAPTDFVVISLHDGQVIQEQDIPLTITGNYSSEGSARVWVVLEDAIGQYYLQNPPVEFLGNGKWVANNICPLMGIVQIDFVQVTRDGNDDFKNKVNNQDFGAFAPLHVPHKVLVTISITSQATG